MRSPALQRSNGTQIGLTRARSARSQASSLGSPRLQPSSLRPVVVRRACSGTRLASVAVEASDLSPSIRAPLRVSLTAAHPSRGSSWVPYACRAPARRSSSLRSAVAARRRAHVELVQACLRRHERSTALIGPALASRFTGPAPALRWRRTRPVLHRPAPSSSSTTSPSRPFLLHSLGKRPFLLQDLRKAAADTRWRGHLLVRRPEGVPCVQGLGRQGRLPRQNARVASRIVDGGRAGPPDRVGVPQPGAGSTVADRRGRARRAPHSRQEGQAAGGRDPRPGCPRCAARPLCPLCEGGLRAGTPRAESRY